MGNFLFGKVNHLLAINFNITSHIRIWLTTCSLGISDFLID